MTQPSRARCHKETNYTVRTVNHSKQELPIHGQCPPRHSRKSSSGRIAAFRSPVPPRKFSAAAGHAWRLHTRRASDFAATPAFKPKSAAIVALKQQANSASAMMGFVESRREKTVAQTAPAPKSHQWKEGASAPLSLHLNQHRIKGCRRPHIGEPLRGQHIHILPVLGELGPIQ